MTKDKTSKRTGAAARWLRLTVLALIGFTQGAWAEDRTLTSDGNGGWYINMPKTGTDNLTIPSGVTSFKVYDDGGKGGTGYSQYDTSGGNYSNKCYGTLVLTAPAGYVLQVSGTVTTEGSKNDYLWVHDGSSTDATRLGEFYSSRAGTTIDITTCASSGTQMTLFFKSDGSGNYDGLDLTVTLINTTTPHSITITDATGGSVAATVSGSLATTATLGQTVTLTATSSEGYLLNGITVTDANSNSVTVTGGTFISDNIATFTMPVSAVTITPTFTNTLTADGGLYINMPTTGSVSGTIPSGVTSFKVYDNGGSSNYYSKNCDGTLVLTAPTGYVLQVTGTVRTESGNCDYLQVHDGSSTSAAQLGKFASSSSGTATAITTCTSSGTAMTLFFKSDGGYNYAGLDLTVTLISAADLAYAAISGISDSYILTGENIKPEPIVTDAMHNVLTKGTDYTLTWSGDGTTAGTYTVTATGTGNYSGTISKEYTVKAAALTISSAADWNTFASSVSGGTTYSGEIVKLGANITVSTMAGTSEANSFQGTFEGDGHTLTLSLGATSDNCAPFAMLKNATIQNLNIAGTISTSAKFGASIAALTYGTTNIRNCHSTVEITGTVSGDGTHGGFVGVNQGSATLNFDNCLFTGKMLGNTATSNGGFVGWNAGTAINYTVCLFAPTELTMVGDGTFNRNGKNTFNRCYYSQTFGEAQGTLATAEQLASGEVCYLLNGSTSDGTLAWYQTIDEDTTPVLDKTHKTVRYAGGTVGYLNDALTIDDNAAFSVENEVSGVNVTFNRTFTAGNWSTIILPFALTDAQMTVAFSGYTYKVAGLTGASDQTLSFTGVTSMDANTPYLIKFTETAPTSLTFDAVTLSEASGTNSSPAGYGSIVGSYDETSVPQGAYILQQNKIWLVTTDDVKIKPFRAYLSYSEPAMAPARSLSFFVDGDATGIATIEADGSVNSDGDAWYTIGGQRLSAKPTVGGVYIHNGKTVVIK